MNRLFENSREEKFIHLLGTIFGVLIYLICKSLSKYNKGVKYLLCAIDLFSKYAWVIPLKDKRRITIVNAFQKIISEGRKPIKIWFDQGGEFANKIFKRFLRINSIKYIQHKMKENLLLLKDYYDVEKQYF